MLWTYRTLFSLIDPAKRRRFWLIVVLTLLTAVLDLGGVAMVIPFLTVLADPEIAFNQPILANIYERLNFSSTYAFLQALGLATFVLVMSGIAVRALSVYMIQLFARQVNMAFAMARLERYLLQPYEWFLQQHSADLGKSVLQEINEIVNGSVAPALRIISNSFLIILLAALLLLVQPLGAITIAFVFGTSFWAIDRAVRRQIGEMGKDQRRANRERHQVTNEALAGIKEVKVMSLETLYLKRFFGPSRRLAAYQARLQLVGEMPRFALEGLTFGGMLGFTLWLLWTSEGALGTVVPVLGAFAFAALRLMPTAQLLFRDIALMRFGRAALAGLLDDLADPSSVTMPDIDAEPLPFKRSFQLEHVQFSYPASERAALKDVSLEIEAGTTVGFMGPTGAGKSTVIDLILGLVTPSGGRFLVDGVPVDDGNRQNWQRNVGFVPQSIYLFDDSIAANIAHGVSGGDIDMEQVRHAARLARIDDYIETMPEGYDSFVGDAGIRLSGGQRQRVGIARALYRDRDVLVFDEATSALDAVTEREVMDAIRSLAGTKTLILVSHRLSTLAHCDEIFVLEHGRVVDRGSYAELKASNASFQSMLAEA